MTNERREKFQKFKRSVQGKQFNFMEEIVHFQVDVDLLIKGCLKYSQVCRKRHQILQ